MNRQRNLTFICSAVSILFLIVGFFLFCSCHICLNYVMFFLFHTYLHYFEHLHLDIVIRNKHKAFIVEETFFFWTIVSQTPQYALIFLTPCVLWHRRGPIQNRTNSFRAIRAHTQTRRLSWTIWIVKQWAGPCLIKTCELSFSNWHNSYINFAIENYCC
jgi:hypothetical protein